MKFTACKDGRHGACEWKVDVPQLDAEAEVTFIDQHVCECWCHVTQIPDPEPGEVRFDPTPTD